MGVPLLVGGRLGHLHFACENLRLPPAHAVRTGRT